MRRVVLTEDCSSEVLAALVEAHNETARFLTVLRDQLVARGLVKNLPPVPAHITVERRH